MGAVGPHLMISLALPGNEASLFQYFGELTVFHWLDHNSNLPGLKSQYIDGVDRRNDECVHTEDSCGLCVTITNPY